MKNWRGALAAGIAVLAVTSCGGPPAHRTPTGQSQSRTPPPAAPRLDGPYKVIAGDPDAQPVTWVFAPCGDGCAEVEMGGEGFSQRAAARYVNMNWTIEIHSPRALQCGDGTSVAGTKHYSWNPDTLEGRYWSTADSSRPCGYEQSLDTDPVPLKLTWAGPPRTGA